MDRRPSLGAAIALRPDRKGCLGASRGSGLSNRVPRFRYAIGMLLPMGVARLEAANAAVMARCSRSKSDSPPWSWRRWSCMGWPPQPIHEGPGPEKGINLHPWR